MKYEIAKATNISEFYLVALPEITPGQPQFKNLNSLLQVLSPGTSPVTLATIDHFFNAGGVMILALHKRRIVGISTLVTITKINGLTGKIEQVFIDQQHYDRRLLRKMTLELIKIARGRKLRFSI